MHNIHMFIISYLYMYTYIKQYIVLGVVYSNKKKYGVSMYVPLYSEFIIYSGVCIYAYIHTPFY
jgi:hypothetical protein